MARSDQAIGAHLRAERKRRKMSLRELAGRLGVTPSLISQIETGKSKPSVVTLYGLASELKLSIDDLLFAGDDVQADRPLDTAAASGSPTGLTRAPGAAPQRAAQRVDPVQRADRRKVIELESGVRWERLTPSDDPDVDFLYCVYDVGGASSSTPGLLRHSGREYGLVIRGRLRITLGFDTHILELGDSISFEATTPHRYANAGDEPVHFVTCVVQVD
ncbi:MAG TPA: cupin domain-containing protein [Actinomycetes bacterium]|nr:cupin domain-containing protein [Actinomycetes bacterium]